LEEAPVAVGDDDRPDVLLVEEILDADELARLPALAALLEAGAQAGDRISGGRVRVQIVDVQLARIARIEGHREAAARVAPGKFAVSGVLRDRRQEIAPLHWAGARKAVFELCRDASERKIEVRVRVQRQVPTQFGAVSLGARRILERRAPTDRARDDDF